MAINFPNSPSDGQLYSDPNTGNLYRYSSSKSAWKSYSNNTTITVGTSAPASPLNGSLWWDTDTGRLFIYYTDGDSNQWVEAAPTISGFDPAIIATYIAPSYNTANLSYTTANIAYTTSQLAYVQANSSFAAANTKATTGKAIAMAIVFGG